MSTEKRIIKFYLDKKMNKSKKEKIIKFLSECQEVENKLLAYYWDNFDKVIKSRTKIDFNYNAHKIHSPKLKSHHYQQVLQMVYAQLKSIEHKNKNKIRFQFEDKERQKIYNYFSKFCFHWDDLKKYTDKQLKKFKKVDKNYFDFLLSVSDILNNNEQFNQIKEEIENKFWELKNQTSIPVKKEFQIFCNTAHTIKDIKMKEFQWLFIVDSNEVIGGTDKKPVFDKMIIPVKFSDYHKRKLKNKELASTFNIKLNKYGRIEIIATFEEDIKYPTLKPKEFLGIDIGLNKLIATSDGEFVHQNKKLVNLAKRIRSKHSNRTKLTLHLRNKHNDDTYELPNKNYLKMERKLTQSVKCDNRRRIKDFLKDRTDYHIIIEDLTIADGKMLNKESNYLLRRLNVQQVVNDIEKYCKEFGIKLSKINPAYTSQECHVCGHTSKRNRKTQEKFSCQICDNECNADYNAAVNIMNRLFDKRITLYTPNWRIKEILNVIDD